jgi:hypothetical protein
MVKIESVIWKDELGGEIERKVIDAYSYGFSVGPHGVWELIIAKENKEVKKNELTNIKIEDIVLPPKAIALPCVIMRHALGLVVSLVAAGKPKLVEERRTLNEAIFHPLFDGTINKGDLLCVVNVFYASIERRLRKGAAEKWLHERYRF